jgi:hypothetical protein
MSNTPLEPKQRGNVLNYYSGNSNATHTKSTGEWISLLLTNDGSSNLTYTVNNITQTLLPGDIIDEDFGNFNSIIINTTVNYRLWLRG